MRLDLAIELRKHAGTRGGRGVLLATAVLTILLGVTGAVVADGEPLAVSRALTYPMTLLEIGLPIIVVLLFTTEWSARDSVQTFLLRPRRGVVLWSKCLAAAVVLAAGLALGLASSLLAVGVRSLVTTTPVSLAGLGGADGALTRSVLTTLLYGAFAVGVGLLVARTAVGLVVYLGAISLVETLLALSLGERSAWLSLSQAVSRLSSVDVHAADLPSIATAVGLWIVVPLVGGSLAFLRREAR